MSDKEIVVRYFEIFSPKTSRLYSIRVELAFNLFTNLFDMLCDKGWIKMQPIHQEDYDMRLKKDRMYTLNIDKKTLEDALKNI